jgi:hypothetical protein
MKRFWMSYDFGIDGDYDGLYAWLDNIDAHECGDGCCSFQLDIGEKKPEAAVLGALKKNHVKLRPKDRIYLIWRREGGAVTGKFVAGSRKRAPWSGYAVQASDEDTESEDAA